MAEDEAKAVEEEVASCGAGGGARKKAKILVEDLYPGKHVTTGKAAASFTATGMELKTGNECREATEMEIREVRWKFARKVGRVFVCVLPRLDLATLDSTSVSIALYPYSTAGQEGLRPTANILREPQH